jgi:hypothetical protein
MNPDIQSHFEQCYDHDGTLHIKISKEFIKQIKWWSPESLGSELVLSFGNIEKMNDWGNDVHLTLKRKQM